MYTYKTHINCTNIKYLRHKVEKITAEIIRREFLESKWPIIIAIGGPGGTGKSSFAKVLAKALPDTKILGLDHYKTPRTFRKDKNIFGPHPEANDIELISSHLKAIKNSKPFDQPIYNRNTGKADKTLKFEPTKLTIIDGEISTYHIFKPYVDFIIYIDAHWKTQLLTRINRDISERGHSHKKAITTYLHSNLNEFEIYGKESKKWADICIFSRDDYSLVIESISENLFDKYKGIFEDTLIPTDFSELICSIPTPFQDDSSIDETAFIDHLEFLYNKGITRILINGILGEFFSLTPDERRLLLSLAKRYFPGLVIFQIGSDSLALSKQEAKRAEDYGADGVVVLPPYFLTNLHEQGLINYFNEISDKIKIPLIIHNIPRNTQNLITQPMLAQIAHFGLQDSSHNFSLTKSTNHYYTSDDTQILQSFIKGAYGFISELGAAHPELLVEIQEALRNNDVKKASHLQEKISMMCIPLDSHDYIKKIKEKIASQIEGYPTKVRLPLI